MIFPCSLCVQQAESKLCRQEAQKLDGPEPAFFAKVMYGDEDILVLGVDQERFRK